MSDRDGHTSRLNRALPGWAVDAIQLGIPERDARDRRRVWTMAMRIAMSAHRRGWSETEYLTEITTGAVGINRRHHEGGLWRQVVTRPDGRRHPDSYGYKTLRSAWEAGLDNANNTGVRTKEEIAADAVELAYRWVDRITDGIDGLTDVEAAVLGYVIAETERRGYLQVTCPARDVGEFAKVPYRTAARVLSRLTGRGLIKKHSPGRRGAGRNRKAAIFGLVDPGTLETTDSASSGLP